MSLIISAFAPVSDVRGTLTPQLRTDRGPSELLLVDLSAGRRRMGASILAQVFGQLGDDAPDLDAPERFKTFFAVIQQALQAGELLAYHDRSDGGLFVTLVEMAFAGRSGISVDLDALGGDALAALFNEELGVVLQVAEAKVEQVMQRFADAGLGSLLTRVGKPTKDDKVTLMKGGKRLFQGSRSQLQQLWSETSYRIQKLRDNPDCADEEFEALAADDPGLSSSLSFDPEDDVSAPFITRSRPRVAVLREQGVNSQVEMAAAFHLAGFDAVDVHMSDILARRVDLGSFKGLVACGGFSYGDVLGAGEGWAKTILFNSLARDQFEVFFNRDDTFTLGVCNGCQMLSNLKELIPGADHWPRFVRNLSEQFEARFSLVRIEESASLLLADMAGSHLPIAVAHGEGRAEFASESALERLEGSGTTAMRFIDNRLQTAATYPANPNGSPNGITGVCSLDGRATIMMPHPERVFRTVTNSWHPDDWGEFSPWMRLFRNARRFVG